jgi:cell division protein FtsI/penicillin-binding protein 2
MRQWPAILTAVAAVAAVVPVARHFASAGDVPLRATRGADSVPTSPNAVNPPALTGIQIERMQLGATEATAPATAGRTAHLTVNPALQRDTLALFRKHKIPEGATVLMDIKSGQVLVYASQQQGGAARDLCAEASAPAASVFKTITGSALVEKAGLTPQTRQCYHGGSERLYAADLEDDPAKDKWCATLSEAMGRSLNTVFARLAKKNLDLAAMQAITGAYGFGLPPPFDLPVQPSTFTPPDDPLGFARTAAGFWNTTLSPIHAAMIASTIASKGVMVRPVIVASVTDPSGAPIYRSADEPQIVRRPVKPETADAVHEMMDATVAQGTGYRSFHDAGGLPFLPNIKLAGKTGTLTRAKTQQFYTWFVGFAPSDAPQIAIATLVINNPNWQTRANVLARDVLRLYFASKNAPGVTKP